MPNHPFKTSMFLCFTPTSAFGASNVWRSALMPSSSPDVRSEWQEWEDKPKKNRAANAIWCYVSIIIYIYMYILYGILDIMGCIHPLSLGTFMSCVAHKESKSWHCTEFGKCIWWCKSAPKCAWTRMVKFKCYIVRIIRIIRDLDYSSSHSMIVGVISYAAT